MKQPSRSTGLNGVARRVKRRFFPLDEQLGISSSHFSPRVEETMTRLGSRMTYAEAAEEMHLLWGVVVTKGTIRNQTMAHGHAAERLAIAEVERMETQAPQPTATPDQLVMSTDGAFVQVTSGDWREVKTVVLGEFKDHVTKKRGKVVTKTEQLSYFSRMESSAEFERNALYEWHQRGGEKANRVVAVNDGAVWIQGFIDHHCPDAIRVLDFAHAQATVATIGKAVYGADTEQFKGWYADISKQLGKQSPDRLLADLRLLQKAHDPDGQDSEIDRAIRYLDKRKSMIDYAHLRQQRVPIGSGIAESGHKVVMQKRMKLSGMRWAEENVNPMLTLRTILCNGRWAQQWPEIRKAKLACRIKSKESVVSEPITIDSVGVRTVNDSVPADEEDTIPVVSKPHPWREGKWPVQNRY